MLKMVGNALKKKGEPIVLSPVNTESNQPEFKLIEKDEETVAPVIESVKEKPLAMAPVEPIQTVLPKEEIKPARKTGKENSEADIALEIKEFPKEPVEEQEEGKGKEV